jgi:hypothetical protein
MKGETMTTELPPPPALTPTPSGDDLAEWLGSNLGGVSQRELTKLIELGLEMDDLGTPSVKVTTWGAWVWARRNGHPDLEWGEDRFFLPFA